MEKIICIILGAGTGIGRAVCNLFANEGAVVVGVGLTDTSNAVIHLPQHNKNMSHIAYDLDVSCETSIKKLMENVIQVFFVCFYHILILKEIKGSVLKKDIS